MQTTTAAEHGSDYGDFHPVIDRPLARPMSAGRGLLIVIIALGIGLIFNSAGVLHVAVGMRPGVTRTMALSLARPVDMFSHALWLDRPKQELDRMFGHQLDSTGGAGLANGDDAILRAELNQVEESSGLRTPAEPPIVSPTTGDPLRVLVLGDSLSTFVGQQLDNLGQARKLITVRQSFKDGTGLNTPEFFNWQAAAQKEIRNARAQAVVMVLGGNDAQGMTHNDEDLEPDTDAWQQEYARRVAVIMQSAVHAGAQRIYWSGPPTARSHTWDASYRRVNAAIARAAQAIPGARFVDLYHDEGGGTGYSDFSYVDGQRIQARQSDGIHWTFDGSRAPAETISEQLEQDYGNIF